MISCAYCLESCPNQGDFQLEKVDPGWPRLTQVDLGWPKLAPGWPLVDPGSCQPRVTSIERQLQS